MSRILIAEDEPRIATFIERGLRAQGHSPTVISDGGEALEGARSGGYDLLVLDLGLPTMDGLDVLRTLRGEGSDLPVVVLTARDAVEDRVAGLDGGADDYLPKPFALEELIARIRARLRPATPDAPATLVLGDLRLDLRTRRIDVAGRTIDLSAREFALAEAFCRHPDQVLSREQLLSQVWGFDFDPGSNVVEVYVRYLRRKIGSDRIETVRGMGYRLSARP